MALVLPNRSLIAPRSNPFAYPAGATPGFDPTHVASPSIRLSTVATIGTTNFLNLLNGKPGTIVGGGSLYSGVDGRLGPIAGSTAAASYVTFPAMSTAAETQNTIAAIFTPRVSQGFAAVFQSDGSTNNCLFITSNANATIFINGGHFSCAVPFVNGAPYFIVVALNANIAGCPTGIVVANTLTGQVFSNFGLMSGTPAASHTPTLYYVLSDIFDTPGLSIAAVMYSAAAMSASQMFQWAADPWAFWYPRSQYQIVGSASPPSTTIPWNSRLALLGVG